MTYSALQVGPGIRVSFHYVVYNEEKHLLQQSDPDAPLTYIHGYKQIIPGLEHELEGLVIGQRKKVTLTCEEAYGPYDAKGCFEIGYEEFAQPTDVSLNDEFVLEDNQGNEATLRIVELLDDCFIADTNHPLAGQQLYFEITVSDVQAATSEELVQAESNFTKLAEWVEAYAPSLNTKTLTASSESLLPVEHLLRSRSRLT